MEKETEQSNRTVRLVCPSTPHLPTLSAFEDPLKDDTPVPVPTLTLQQNVQDEAGRLRQCGSNANSSTDSSSIASTSGAVPHADVLLRAPPKPTVSIGHPTLSPITLSSPESVPANTTSVTTGASISNPVDATISANVPPTSFPVKHLKNPLPIHIRKAHLADIPRMAEILTASFWDECAIGRFMHPKRKEHPRDYYRYWRRRVARGICDWHREMYVAVIHPRDALNSNQHTSKDSGGGSSEVIVGVVDWADYPAISAKRGTKWLFREFLAYQRFLLV
jgi:hypothetical protein